MPASMSLPIVAAGQLLIGLDQDFAGLHVDDVGGDVGAFEIVGGDFHLLDLRLLDFLEDAGGDLAALRDDRVAALGVMAWESFRPISASLTFQKQLLVLQVDLAALVERRAESPHRS